MRVAAQRFRVVFLYVGTGPPSPRQKVCKVFEEETLSLDFGCCYGTKIESPAGAGLGFFPDLIVAAVSRGQEELCRAKEMQRDQE